MSEGQRINVEHDINIHLENKSVSRHFFVFLFIMYTVVYMTKNCFSGALADIVRDGVMTKSQTGLITAVFYIVYAPLQIVGGIVADRVSSELMIKIGLIGGAVANAVIFFNHNYVVMLVTWTLNAVVQFALWPSTFKIISSQLCRSDRSYMIFFISLAASLGLLLTYAVAALLPSWEYNFAFSAVVLLLFAVFIHIYDRHLNPYMKHDCKPAETSVSSATYKYNGSTFGLFMKSGLVLLLVPVLVRAYVGQGIKTLAPTMLMESYGVEPSVGNLLNTLIIISGVLGTMLVRLVLYPKIIKNPVFGAMITLSASLVFLAGMLVVPGLLSTFVFLCLAAVFTTAPSLFMSYFYASYSKYGKNATAAGIGNAAGSVGIVVTSYVIVKIAEVSSWETVKAVWFGSVLTAVICLLIVLFLNRRFKRLESEQLTLNIAEDVSSR